MSGIPVFVEIPIRTTMSDLWAKTQDPVQHTRWDLRFTEIRYLPRTGAQQVQRFQYETRLGFGLAVRGYGETAASTAEGVSALRFSSEEAISLIREGSGCWVYKPQPDGVLFRTVYTYDVRFGMPGRLLDRWLFRPLMGWATAWSFDRLRLWAERGIEPELSGRMALLHGLARLLLGVAWAYDGLAPGWLFPEALAEVSLGLMIVLWGRSRWVLGLSALALITRMNVLTWNITLLGLTAAAWLTESAAPGAARCRRKPEGRR